MAVARSADISFGMFSRLEDVSGFIWQHRADPEPEVCLLLARSSTETKNFTVYRAPTVEIWPVLHSNPADVQGLQVPESFKMPSTSSSLTALVAVEKPVASSFPLGQRGCADCSRGSKAVAPVVTVVMVVLAVIVYCTEQVHLLGRFCFLP